MIPRTASWDWTADAACANHPEPDMWLMDDLQGRPSDDSVAYARAICAGCPVRTDCLQAALQMERGLTVSHRHGIWGGLGPRERSGLERRIRNGKAPALVDGGFTPKSKPSKDSDTRVRGALAGASTSAAGGAA